MVISEIAPPMSDKRLMVTLILFEMPRTIKILWVSGAWRGPQRLQHDHRSGHAVPRNIGKINRLIRHDRFAQRKVDHRLPRSLRSARHRP